MPEGRRGADMMPEGRRRAAHDTFDFESFDASKVEGYVTKCSPHKEVGGRGHRVL